MPDVYVAEHSTGAWVFDDSIPVARIPVAGETLVAGDEVYRVKHVEHRWDSRGAFAVLSVELIGKADGFRGRAGDG